MKEINVDVKVKDADGKPLGAANVRDRIHQLRAEGLSYADIAATLVSEGWKSKGGDVSWSRSAVRYHLDAEKSKIDEFGSPHNEEPSSALKVLADEVLPETTDSGFPDRVKDQDPYAAINYATALGMRSGERLLDPSLGRRDERSPADVMIIDILRSGAMEALSALGLSLPEGSRLELSVSWS